MISAQHLTSSSPLAPAPLTADNYNFDFTADYAELPPPPSTPRSPARALPSPGRTSPPSPLKEQLRGLPRGSPAAVGSGQLRSAQAHPAAPPPRLSSIVKTKGGALRGGRPAGPGGCAGHGAEAAEPRGGGAGLRCRGDDGRQRPRAAGGVLAAAELPAWLRQAQRNLRARAAGECPLLGWSPGRGSR